jgi:hypothetical protein
MVKLIFLSINKKQTQTITEKKSSFRMKCSTSLFLYTLFDLLMFFFLFVAHFKFDRLLFSLFIIHLP